MGPEPRPTRCTFFFKKYEFLFQSLFRITRHRRRLSRPTIHDSEAAQIHKHDGLQFDGLRVHVLPLHLLLHRGGESGDQGSRNCILFLPLEYSGYRRHRG